MEFESVEEALGFLLDVNHQDNDVNCPSLKTEACNSRPYGQW